MTIDLYDITGKLVFRFSTNIGMGINTISIPLDDLKGGVYFYSVILNAEILKSDKIIITK